MRIFHMTRQALWDADAGGGTHPFPHVYGPLNTEAVVDVHFLEPDPSGDFTETAALFLRQEPLL